MAISSEDETSIFENEASAETASYPLPSIPDVLADPGTSYWLKAAIQSLVVRDPVDALNDALVLAALFDARLRSVLGVEGDPPQRREERV